MRVWIGTDMEGVAGVVGGEQTRPTGRSFESARKWLTNETNIIAGVCFDHGADAVMVADTHGSCENIIWEDLHPRAQLYSGKIATLPHSGVRGLDSTYDCAFLVGYHVRAGRHPGLLDHTAWSQTVAEVRVNGQPVGETELVSGYAGSLGVPVLMVLGDDVLAEDLKETMPGVRAVTLKKAVARFEAIHESQEVVYERIRKNTEEVLARRHEVEPFRFETPVTMELVFKHPSYADLAEMVPLCERTGVDTVAFTGNDFARDVYPAFCSMCGISAVAYYQGS